MKNPFKTVRLKSAAPRLQHFDLSSNHLTTSDFAQLSPVYYRDLVPKDHFKIQMNVGAYTAPLVVPPIANAHIKTRAFFCPYRLVYPHFNEFLNSTLVNDGDGNLVTPSIPTVLTSDFINLFIEHAAPSEDAASSYTYINSLCYIVGESTTEGDFVVWTDSSTRGNCYNFTAHGRRIYKILRSLGYAWNWYLNDEQIYNALPILCFARVYWEYFRPSQIALISDALSVLESVKLNIGHTLDYYDLYNLLFNCAYYYPNDYFTSAWEKPNQVSSVDYINTNSSFGADYPISAQSTTYNQITADSYASAYVRSNNTSALSRVTQYGLDLLNSVDQWLKRNNYAGAARATDAILARFGVRVPDATLDRPEFIGFDDTPIKWQQITNTAASSDPDLALGTFGGKGFAASDPHTFEYTAKEHGMLLFLSVIVPDAMYYHGCDRQNLQTDALDFFQPEFERLGTSPIKSQELFSDATFSSLDSAQPLSAGLLETMGVLSSNVFGFCPNYANYKVPHDLITGDFVVSSLNNELSSWHFGREFAWYAEGQDSEFYALTPRSILNYSQYYSEYNRIFNITDTSVDHFIEVFSFNVDAERPMLSISDSIPLDGNGEDVTLQPNGSRMS